MYTSIIYGLLVDYVISNTDYCPGYIIDQWSMRALQQGDGGICPPHFKISLPPPHFYYNIYFDWLVPPTYIIVPAPIMVILYIILSIQ